MQKFRNNYNGGQAIISIYRSKWVSGYSTAATTTSSITCNFMVDYLINSLGFSVEQAVVTSSKVSHFKSTQNSISVVDFFKSSGFDQTQIKNIVINDPRILSCKVDKTLKPKINALSDIGFSKSDLAYVIAAYPAFCFKRSLNDHIIPAIGHLKSVFDDNESLIKALKKSTWLLSASVRSNLPKVVSLLKSYGLSNDQIKAFGLRKPRFLVLDTKSLQAVLIRVERLGIPRDSAMFVHGLCALCSLSEKSLELRMDVFKNFGFTDSDVLTLGRKNPYALTVSESKLNIVLKFFLKVAGFQPAVIASMPALLTLSLDKRVIPRYKIWQVLNERGIMKTRASLGTCLFIAEPQFFKKCVLPFKDAIPDLYEDYVKKLNLTMETAEQPEM